MVSPNYNCSCKDVRNEKEGINEKISSETGKVVVHNPRWVLG